MAVVVDWEPRVQGLPALATLACQVLWHTEAFGGMHRRPGISPPVDWGGDHRAALVVSAGPLACQMLCPNSTLEVLCGCVRQPLGQPLVTRSGCRPWRQALQTKHTAQ